MSWIEPIQMNMSISYTILEGKWDNFLIDMVQKIALYTVIPFLLIATFEALFKNLILITFTNCVITLLNAGHSLYQHLHQHFYVNP